MLTEILKTDRVITIIGSGGKTTTMFNLAKNFVKKFHKNVLITTTTKIFNTDLFPVVISNKLDDFLKIKGDIIIGGGSITEENKITPIEENLLENLRNYFSLILIEGDGSKGKSIKAYKEYEPVIPDFTDFLITVIGLDVIGKPFNDNTVHRFEVMKKFINKEVNSLITKEDIVEIFLKIYLPEITISTENYLLLNKAKNFKEANFIKNEILKNTDRIKDIFIQTYLK